MNDRFRHLITGGLMARDMTVNELSRKAKVSRDVLYRFLNKKTASISSDTLATVFEFLGIEVGFNDQKASE